MLYITPSCFLVGFLVGLAPANSAIVPGRVFDRFISIWLENQVRSKYNFLK